MRRKVRPRVWFPALACKSHDSKNWPVCLSSLSFCYFALFIVFMVVGLLTMSYGAFLPRLTIIKRNLKNRTSWERGMRRKVPSRVWSPAPACVFPRFVHPSWHEMIWLDCSHGSLNLGILDDQTPSMHFGFGEEIMCFSRMWLPSLAWPWPQSYGFQIYRWWVFLLFLGCFPGCGFPAWHVHGHKSMALRFTDDGSVFFFLSLGCFAGCGFLWLPPLNMMGITLTIFGLVSRIWFPSLALAMTTNLWHPILDLMDTTLIIFGLIFRRWFPN